MQLHLGLLPLSEAEIWDISKYLSLTKTLAPASSETTELAQLHCLTHLGNHPVPALQQPATATPVQLEKLGAKQVTQQQVTVTLGKNMGVVTLGHMKA